MKKIIKGKTYNTETAMNVCSRKIYNQVVNSGVYMDFHSATQTLYRTKKGLYFLVAKHNPYNGFVRQNFLSPLSDDEAKNFYHKYSNLY